MTKWMQTVMSGETKREIERTEAEMIDLLAQIMLLKQHGENINLDRDANDGYIVTRMVRGKEVVTTFKKMELKKAYVLRTIDYTLKRKGDRAFTIVDEDGKYLNFGMWKNRKACIEAFNENHWGVQGYELQSEMLTKHQHYSHWEEFEFAK